MLSRKQCDNWVRRKVGNTLFAHRIGVNLEITGITQVYEPVWQKKQKDEELTINELREIAQTHWGVIRELRVNLKVRPPEFKFRRAPVREHQTCRLKSKASRVGYVMRDRNLEVGLRSFETAFLT